MHLGIFGSTGFIGRHLVRALAARNVRISLYNRRPWGPLPTGVTEQVGALDDFDRMKSVLKSAEGVFYLVWNGYPHSETRSVGPGPGTNVYTAASVLEQVAQRRGRRIVFLSSGGTVYGEPSYLPIDEGHPTNPISAYGVEKLAVENHLLHMSKSLSVQAVVVRPSTVFGPGQRPGRGQGLITTAMDRLRRGEYIDVWGSGSEVRDYLFIDDLVRALILVMERDPGPPVVNIGSERGLPVSQVLGCIAKTTGIEPLVRRHDAPANAVRSNVLSCALAHRVLGWWPVIPFEEGLAKTWEWIRNGQVQK
jgi:UDP-glucose 4-epimerase